MDTFNSSMQQISDEKTVKKSRNSTSTISSSSNDPEYGVDEGACGWFSVRPTWVQYFNNPNGYLFFYCLLLGVQGMVVNGMYNVFIPTLERRFQLTSSQTGLIYASFDTGYFVVCLFVTYYGNRAHKLQMLSFSSLIIGFGCLLFAIPHFTTDVYGFKGNSSELCQPNKVDECLNQVEPDRALSSYFYVFVVSMAIIGMGSSTLCTVGYAVIENSLPRDQAALHLGISTSMTILGPVIGYIIGGYLLTIYVDFDKVSDVDLSPSDPSWVGAWWVGFLLSGLLSITLVLPLSGFTRQLPGAEKNRLLRQSEVHKDAGEEKMNDENFGKTFRDMPTAMWTLIKNPTFTCTTLAGISESFLICGYTAFLPKIIQNQFHQTAGKAALYAGVIGIPGGVFGSLISGWILKKWNMSSTSALKLCISTCVIVCVMNAIMLLHCEETEVSGVNTPYNESLNTQGIESSCNSNCTCQEEFYTPVCGADDAVYFTACHAGCTGKTEIDGKEIYTDCSCVAGEDKTAQEDICSEECSVLTPFIILFFFIVLMNFVTTTPAITVTMRCVPESQRTFAMGVTNFVIRGLGCIPGPIIFGSIIDTTCLLWQQLSCDGGRGSCWLYASGDLAVDLFIIGASCKIFSTTLFSLALFSYHPISTVTVEEDLKEEQKLPSQFENPTFDCDEEKESGFIQNNNDNLKSKNFERQINDYIFTTSL